jgi:stage II sporulation protein D
VLLLFLLAAPPIGAAVPVLTIDGKGFGHGVGMAQDGALAMGRSGATLAQILAQFYPGTKVGKGSGSSLVRVAVLTPTDGQAVVAFPNGGEIRDALDGGQSRGFPVRVGAGEQVRLRWDGSRYSVEGGTAGASASAEGEEVSAQQVPPLESTTTSTTGSTTSTTAPASTSTSSTTTSTTPVPAPVHAGPSSNRSLWAVPSGSGGTVSVPGRGRRYRGVLEATAGRGPFHLVNQVDVEAYLKGMGEVRNPSWPAASLRAQAVAARTYALRAMAANGEVCDDTRCQVYLGAQAEYAAMDKAVNDTRGQVVLFGKSLASTVYSANGGAFSASRQEGFGAPDDGGYPYLRPAPYPTQDPLPWTVRVGLTDVAARLAYRGTVSGATVTRAGPSGRALEVTLQGSAGPKAVAGIAFAKAFSLRSTLFTLRAETADAAPALAAGGDGGGLQAPPEEAGPAFDPNVLPPDPLTPDEYASAIPPPEAFTAAPLPDVDVVVAPLSRRSHSWPWLSLALFLLLTAGAAAAGLAVVRRG